MMGRNGKCSGQVDIAVQNGQPNGSEIGWQSANCVRRCYNKCKEGSTIALKSTKPLCNCTKSSAVKSMYRTPLTLPMDWWYNDVFALARKQCGHNHLTGTDEQHKMTLMTAVVQMVVTYSQHARYHRRAVWSPQRNRKHFQPLLTLLAVCHQQTRREGRWLHLFSVLATTAPPRQKGGEI